MKKIDNIIISQGYGGTIKIEARIGDNYYIVEEDLANEILKNEINKGYEITQTKRQKYPRITIK